MAVPAEQINQKSDKPVRSEGSKYVFLNPELYERRKKLLLLVYSGNVNRKSMTALADATNTKYESLQRDLLRRRKWEPIIWGTYQASEDAREFLKFLELARENAIQLMKTAGSDNARVGAIRTLLQVTKAEIELRQSLGMLPKTTTDLTQIIFDQSTTNIDVALKAEIDKIIQFSRIEEKQSERT